ncbi:mitochondrial pyruvate carrier 2-like [Coccinella septempunctata]|uniref:mitochondrial pyruvate carrier 2-like n=1 Tax=Coccinella septempunctata TaxID=41139 RepID=UPI001D0774C8|nr:mitochondrial pyruvate carrier 2-like [Coccinella septempunctata]
MELNIHENDPNNITMEEIHLESRYEHPNESRNTNETTGANSKSTEGRNIDTSNKKETGNSSNWNNVIQNLKNFWNHPAGPLTIFFWAPAFKWGLVIAGLTDLARPAGNISILQTLALAATGIIWCRYSLVIIPKNYSLFSVNLFIAVSQCYQLYRSMKYQYFS